MKELVVALLSVANTACFNLSVFQKTKRQIIHLHTYCSICDIVIYAVLGAKTGIANSVVNLGKNFAYSKMDSIRWTMGFSCLRIVLLVLGYEGPMTAGFIALEIIGVASLAYGTTQQFRIVTLLKQLLWVAYDWVFATAIVACMTLTGAVSCFAAIVRNRNRTD